MVDKIGRVHGWNDEHKVLMIHMQLKGKAEQWLRGQLDRNSNWRDWKDAMLESFPETTDFHTQLCAVAARIKRSDESYAEYYRDMVRLCRTMGADDKQIVSCLIGGLPMHLQPAAYVIKCEAPNQLYNRFLSKLDARAAGASSILREGLPLLPHPQPVPRRFQRSRGRLFQRLRPQRR